MVAICASLAGCADKQVEDDIEIVDEVFKDGNIYEADDEVLDDEIQNEEWTILMSILPADEKEQLREAEREWIAYKDNAVKEAGAPAEGGSIQSMLEYDMGAEITKTRVYELKEMLMLQ